MQKKINIVLPFKALHYNPHKITDIGECLAQPYDVISPENQERYYQKHPNNIIRLILNKNEAGDTETYNAYTRANEFLSSWIRDDILTSSSHPAFWIYEQEYQIPGTEKKKITGFIGLVKLADFEEMRILPHEKILKGPLEDRIKLTRTTHTQLEYIWGLYRDKDCVIDKILESCRQEKPVLDYFEEEFQVQHSLRQLADGNKTGKIREAMEKHKIYIADGHHRYNTMLAIRNEMRSRFPGAGADAPWEYIMVYLTNAEHEGLTILPTHRMVHNLQINDPGYAKIEKIIQDYFTVKKYTLGQGKGSTALRKTWLEEIRRAETGEYKIGMYRGKGEYHVLTLKNTAGYEALYKERHSREWMFLDVNILNTLVIKHILGITEEQLALNTNIKYTIDENEAIANVDSGKMEFAFILNATGVDEIINVSDNKEIMPRKSTYFYPKPVSGLVMYPMADIKD